MNTGLNDQTNERRIVWSDGSPVDYASWAPGEPNVCQTNGGIAGTGNTCAEAEDFVEMDFRGGNCNLTSDLALLVISLDYL